MTGVVVKSRQTLAMLGKESLNNLLMGRMWDLIEREIREDSKTFSLIQLEGWS